MTGTGAARYCAPKNRPHFPQIEHDYCLLIPREVQRVIHNHPSGDPSPSQADIEMTRTIINTARPLGIIVHDHVILGKNGHASLRAMQLI